MKRNMLHRLVAMAAAGTMLMSVAACGSSSDDNAATSNSSDTSLISVNNSEPQNGLIPSDTNEMGGGRVIRYLFEGLVSFDAKGKQHPRSRREYHPERGCHQVHDQTEEGLEVHQRRGSNRPFLRRHLEFRRQCEERAEDLEPLLHHQGL